MEDLTSKVVAKITYLCITLILQTHSFLSFLEKIRFKQCWGIMGLFSYLRALSTTIFGLSRVL